MFSSVQDVSKRLGRPIGVISARKCFAVHCLVAHNEQTTGTTHSLTHAHSRACTHTLTRSDRHTHTRTHTHTHTHTLTHTRFRHLCAAHPNG